MLEMSRQASPTGMWWYRYDDVQYAAPLDEWGEPQGAGEVKVHCTEYPVVRYTLKGAWLDVGPHLRWVGREARKRFACPTREEAMASFVARKKAQKRILLGQLRRVEKALKEVERDGR